MVGMAVHSFRWQSRLILLLVVPAAGVFASVQTPGTPLGNAAGAAAFSVAMGLAVLFARAGSGGAVLLGMLLAYCYGVTPSFPHSGLWPLAAALVLTLGCSRVGRARKRAHEPAEEPTRRSAVQVAANLGAGALAGATLNAHGALAAHTAMLAALAELTADTLGSELGQLSPWLPRMLLTGKVAAPGTDGAISLPGTAAATLGGCLVAAVGAWAFALPVRFAGVAVLCGVAGMLLDSVLGQLLEHRGLLHNDTVNFLSNVAAAGAALVVADRMR